MFSLKQIVEEIAKKSEMSEKEINKMIEEKQTELSGLVSPEGAAYIVGKELGVNLLKETKRELKIKNIVSGMRSVDVTGRVIQIFEPRDFERSGKKGSVVNLIIGDSTGTVRMSLWNNEIEILKSLDIKEDDIVKITGGFVKEDNRGNYELRVGKGKLEKLDEVKEIPKIEDIKQDFERVGTKKIHDLKEGEQGEIRASLVQVFRRNPFFEVCPKCGVRVEKEGDVWKCKDHDKVEPKHEALLSGVVDDGSGNIRVVFFRNLAENVLGKKAEELREIVSKEGDLFSVYDNLDSLGKEFVMRGRVKKNQFTERLEFIVNEVDEVDVKKECEDLVKKIGSINKD
jgi:replication factor A1